ENKETLTKILTYHVVPGRLTATALMKAIKDGEGTAKLKTVAGGDIWVKQAGPGRLTITDAKGHVASVSIADVLQSNGVIHVIDPVLLRLGFLQTRRCSDQGCTAFLQSRSCEQIRTAGSLD